MAKSVLIRQRDREKVTGFPRSIKSARSREQRKESGKWKELSAECQTSGKVRSFSFTLPILIRPGVHGKSRQKWRKLQPCLYISTNEKKQRGRCNSFDTTHSFEYFLRAKKTNRCFIVTYFLSRFNYYCYLSRNVISLFLPLSFSNPWLMRVEN